MSLLPFEQNSDLPRSSFCIVNIGLLVTKASKGGHARSAATIAACLQHMGHNLVIILDKCARDDAFIPHNLCVHRVSYFDDHFYKRNFSNDIMHCIRSFQLDLLHSFESFFGTYHAALVADKMRVPFAWTICGGHPPRTTFGLQLATTYAAEIKQYLENHNNITVELIPGRLDANKLRDDLNEAKGYLRRALGMTNHEIIVLRIARLSANYERSITEGMLAVSQLASKRPNLRFVHVGHAEDPNVARRLQSLAERINATHPNPLIRFAPPALAHNAVSTIPDAHFVIGAGRSALEALTLGKPTLIVGKYGFAGLVNEMTISHLEKHNFAGRGIDSLHSTASVSLVAETIDKLLASENAYNKTSRFGIKLIDDQYSVRAAAIMYLRHYEYLQAQRNSPYSKCRYYLDPSLLRPRLIRACNLWRQPYALRALEDK